MTAFTWGCVAAGVVVLAVMLAVLVRSRPRPERCPRCGSADTTPAVLLSDAGCRCRACGSQWAPPPPGGWDRE